jgi:hypothetical protein
MHLSLSLAPPDRSRLLTARRFAPRRQSMLQRQTGSEETITGIGCRASPRHCDQPTTMIFVSHIRRRSVARDLTLNSDLVPEVHVLFVGQVVESLQ